MPSAASNYSYGQIIMLRLISLLLFAFHGFVFADEYQAVVIRVSDGDTIEVKYMNGQKDIIRLANIDAPETSCHQSNENKFQSCVEKAQPYGKESKMYLTDLILNHNVIVDVNPDKDQTDYHYRTIATIYDDGLNINLEMVKHGYAWFNSKFGKKQLTIPEYDEYKNAQLSAINEQRGLWADANQLAPWIFRHK